MSEQGWGQPPQQGDQQGGWGQQPPPPQQPPHPPGWGQQPPPPQQPGWGQQPPPPAGPPQQPGWGQQPPPPQQPPQQPGWGQQPGGLQPYGQQPGGPHPYGAPPPPQGSGGIDPKNAPLIAYIVGWITGLIVYFGNKDQPSRFHGAQSLLLFVPTHLFVILMAVLLPFILGTNVGFGVRVLTGFGYLVYVVLVWGVSLASWALGIYVGVQGQKGNRITLPVIGDVAERWAAR